MIRKDLREEIRLKHKKILGNPKAWDERAKLVRDDLRSIGDVYSFWIENPELRERSIKNLQVKTIKRMAKKGIRQISDAWHYLQNFGQERDFYKVFNDENFVGVNSLINGNKARQGELRVPTRFSNGDVTLNFKDYTVPSARKIPRLVREIIDKVRDNYEHDSLKTAIDAHLAIALTQPFMEANKRTARIIQDRLLVDAGFPPAIIPAGEAKFYYHLLEEVAPNYRDKNDIGQSLFHNYIAAKVNNGLDEILQDIKGIK